MRATSVSPETSLLASRVSETVITAMRTGMNATLSSRRGAGIAHDGIGRHGRRGRRRRYRAGKRICAPRRMVDRPLAARGLVETLSVASHAAAIHPVIRHHALHI